VSFRRGSVVGGGPNLFFCVCWVFQGPNHLRMARLVHSNLPLSFSVLWLAVRPKRRCQQRQNTRISKRELRSRDCSHPVQPRNLKGLILRGRSGGSSTETVRKPTSLASQGVSEASRPPMRLVVERRPRERSEHNGSPASRIRGIRAPQKEEFQGFHAPR